MTKLLITQTLLSGWNYMYDCWESQQESAQESFIKTLNREPFEPTEATVHGLAFEREVYAVVSGSTHPPYEQWKPGIMAVADKLMGASVQVKLYADLNVDGQDYLLCGVLDALKGGVIYDVKFSKSYEVGKYLKSPQTSAYFELVPEAREFQYLISDGNEMWVETYRRHEVRPIEEYIREFVKSIELMGLLGVYEEKWNTIAPIKNHEPAVSGGLRKALVETATKHHPGYPYE